LNRSQATQAPSSSLAGSAMEASFSATPKGRTPSAMPSATPTTTRVAGSHILQASPHYTTTRRHSLYGTEDRVVIDPGSRIWKVGFSGEGKPRDVFYADVVDTGSLWCLTVQVIPRQGLSKIGYLKSPLKEDCVQCSTTSSQYEVPA